MTFNEFMYVYNKVPVEHFNTFKGEKPLVSICIVTYNHENYIRDCLESVLMQKTEFDYEVLLGEDASTDGTRGICKEYALKYSEKIRLFLHKRENNIAINDIPTGRFNFLYNMYNARGKYIALCEGDDYWTDPLKLQKQVDILEANTKYAGSFHITNVYNGNKIIPRKYGMKQPKELSVRATLSRTSPFHTSSFIFRSTYFEMPEWFNEVVSGDMALFSIIAKKGNLRKINEVMSIYRKHSGGITKTKVVRQNFHAQRILLLKYLNEFHDMKFKDKVEEEIAFHETMKNYRPGIIGRLKVKLKNIILQN